MIPTMDGAEGILAAILCLAAVILGVIWITKL